MALPGVNSNINTRIASDWPDSQQIVTHNKSVFNELSSSLV